MARTLLYSLLFFLLWTLSGCPSGQQIRRKTIVKGPRFVLKQQNSRCRLFVDRKGGLQFCVPNGSSWQKAPASSNAGVKPFEVQIVPPQSGMRLLVRKDPLPEDLPKGALSGPWMQRYAEGYLSRRGSSRSRAKVKILHGRRARFLKADVAVWASFPLVHQSGYVWEEVLVLVKRPSTRYLLSIRMTSEGRKNPHQLKRFFVSFLRSLRFHSSAS
jgi:hypothetical protein